MERHELTEQCHHPECSDTRWLRYCVEEGQEITGDAAVNIDMIEAVLYESERFERGNFRYAGNRRDSEFSRSYELYDTLDNEQQVAGVSTHVYISHHHSAFHGKHAYSVAIEWEVPREHKKNRMYRTGYYLEVYPTQLHATITELNLSTELLRTGEMATYHDRPMTGYDHGVLFDLLGRVYSHQEADAIHDDRAVMLTNETT